MSYAQRTPVIGIDLTLDQRLTFQAIQQTGDGGTGDASALGQRIRCQSYWLNRFRVALMVSF